MIRGRHVHVPNRGKHEEPSYTGRRGGYKVNNNDDYWWDSQLQDLVIEGYDLPPNPKKNNEPVWDLYSLAEEHPQEIKRLFWQCEWEGLGHYSGKNKPLSEQACKLIEMACYGRGICKEGKGEYQTVFKKGHPIKNIPVRGLKKR